jgi:hypothetical protein
MSLSFVRSFKNCSNSKKENENAVLQEHSPGGSKVNGVDKVVRHTTTRCGVIVCLSGECNFISYYRFELCGAAGEDCKSCHLVE